MPSDQQDQPKFSEVVFDPPFQTGSMNLPGGGGLVYLRLMHPRHGLLDFFMTAGSAQLLVQGVTKALGVLDIGYIPEGKPN